MTSTMRKADIEQMFATFQAANPHPETELEYSSPFELLTAVLLSAQATDVGVNKATRKLFPVANTPQAMLALGVGEVGPHFKGAEPGVDAEDLGIEPVSVEGRGEGEGNAPPP